MRAHRRRGGPAAARLARRAARLQRDRPPCTGERAGRAPAAGRPGADGRRARVPAQADRHPPPRRARHRRPPRARGDVPHRLVLQQHADLQGPAHGAAAAGLLRRPARARDRDGDGARALALLHQHARLVGSRAPVPLPRAQRRDQHRARQPAVDARARAAAALRPARRRPPQAVPADRRSLERFGRARRRLRAARARRPRARPRAGDADPRRLEPGHADGGRPARVLRVPRRHARAVGRARRHRVLRRTPGRRDARPQRPAALPLPGHARRPARARFRGRRARARPGRRRRERPPASPARC